MIDHRRTLRAIADISRLFTWTFLAPVPVAFLMEPWNLHVLGLTMPATVPAFAAGAAACTLFWLPVRLLTTDDAENLRDREGYLAVALGWLVLSAFAAIPFLASGTLPNVIDAFYEAISGLTTTGASAFRVDLATVPESILFWRAFLQWIGGLGIVVLLVALLAQLTQGGHALMRAEASAHAEQRVRPKLRDTAKTLWRIYSLITLGMILVLWALMLRIDMSPGQALYDAVYHAFTAYATGGFSNHSNSIAYYNDFYIEAAITVFMLIGGTQILLFLPGPKNFLKRLWNDAQWRFYILTFAVAVALVAAMLIRTDYTAPTALRHASFAVATTLTGTGLSAHDFAPWPAGSLAILLALMLMGGNVGSTSGAVKSARWLLMAKLVKRQLRLHLHPRAVIPARLGGRVIPEATLIMTGAFIFLYLTAWLLGTLSFLVLEPFDIIDAASASASTLGNVGVGLGAVGPTGSYATMQPASKIIMAFLMWLGRLELFTVLLVFNPNSWKT